MKYQLNELNQSQIQELGHQLAKGQIAVIPTDTQYGIVTSALKEDSVEKIYQLRRRSKSKPMIILISKIQNITDLGISLTPNQIETLNKFWPNPVSIIIPVTNPNLQYLHRGKQSLAFRMPKVDWLHKLLTVSGPLVAPSANFEGKKPSATINEAEAYFDSQLDFYLDAGLLDNPASTIIQLGQDSFQIIRQGAFTLP